MSHVISGLISNTCLAGGLAIVIFLAQQSQYLRFRPQVCHAAWLLVLVKPASPTFFAIPVGDLAKAAYYHAKRTDLEDGALEGRTHHQTPVGALRAARPLDQFLRDNPRHCVLVESGRLVGAEGTPHSTRTVLRSDGSLAGPRPTRAIRGNTACRSRFCHVQREESLLLRIEAFHLERHMVEARREGEDVQQLEAELQEVRKALQELDRGSE